MVDRGLVLSGKYRLESEIGRGGMGSVWRATRLDLGTELAVKVMHGEASRKADGLERFSREAKAAASLKSPHVVRIIDFGVDTTTSVPFMAMELLEGESLAGRLASQTRLALPTVARIITQVARALHQAHADGIIHRDLKPGNIFLVQNGDDEMVKLLDFGIAKADGALGEGLATATGSVMGTPHYMSPEQVNSLKDIDHRADIWSLGVIAYECATGRRPFSAPTLAELAMKISLGRVDKPSSVAEVPVGFDEWFARATAVDPAGRYQSVSELASALNAIAAHGPREVSSGTPQSLAAAAALALSTTDLGPASTSRESPLRRASSESAAPGLSTTSAGGSIVPSRPGERRPARVGRWALGAAAVIVAGALGANYMRGSSAPPAPATSVAAQPPEPTPVPVSEKLPDVPQATSPAQPSEGSSASVPPVAPSPAPQTPAARGGSDPSTRAEAKRESSRSPKPAPARARREARTKASAVERVDGYDLQ